MLASFSKVACAQEVARACEQQLGHVRADLMHTNVAPGGEATVDAEAKNRVLTSLFQCQIGLRHLPDGRSGRCRRSQHMSRMETCYVFPMFFFSRRRPSGGNLSAHESPEWLCRLENINKASITSVVSSKWVEFLGELPL